MLWGTYVEKSIGGTNLEGYDDLGNWDNGFEMGSRNDCLNTKIRTKMVYGICSNGYGVYSNKSDKLRNPT